ncbi:competence protein CoiA family protein [Brevibacillus borstelensis]|uniref:competence protein CoiA family protein n=1 Tax=Brevibacillus borstelensis TaxID=45462 RepID=UPI002E1F59AA|nr:competence protein CoiA family protein [Brevibacillus borstelensis]
MNIAIYEGKSFNLDQHLRNSDRNREIEVEKLKKRAEKGAFTCPFCNAALIIKSGNQRDTHLSHSFRQSCELVEANETYTKQTKRESKKHSVIRQIIFDELKVQEKIRPELKVEYGYIAKADEKWTHFPDIIVKHDDKELAISVLTNVDRSKDTKLVKQFQKRNQYFQSKGLQTVWFVEEQQMSIDMEHHVIHLWESEIDLAMKTEEDEKWDKLLQELATQGNLFEVFGYWKRSDSIKIDVKSIYYVYSTEEQIEFSVHRFIIDEKKFPFRAFAINSGYRISMPKALSFKRSLSLSDSSVEDAGREAFKEQFFIKLEEYRMKKQEEQDVFDYDTEVEVLGESIKLPQFRETTTKMTYQLLVKKLKEKVGMTQQQQLCLWHNYVLKKGNRNFERIWQLAEDVQTFKELEMRLQRDY